MMVNFKHQEINYFIVKQLIFEKMTNDEKMRLIEETLEMDANTLTEDTVLADVDEFDSMAKLSLIVMCDDEFGKKLSGEELRGFKTVKDILDFLD